MFPGDVADIWDNTRLFKWLQYARADNYGKRKRAPTIARVIQRNSVAARVLPLYAERYNKTLDSKTEIFDTAVSIPNLQAWRMFDEQIQVEYAYWMETALELAAQQQTTPFSSTPWWSEGYDAIMWLLFNEGTTPMAQPGWHYNGLGRPLPLEDSPMDAVNSKLLHWDREAKPWLLPNGHYRGLWDRYRPDECHFQGTCTFSNYTVFWQCVFVKLETHFVAPKHGEMF